MKFYLGTHQTEWTTRVPGPWFLSAPRLRVRPVRKPVLGGWALDSGGFSELSLRGRWTITPEQYAAEAVAWARVMGAPDWIAPQDWMCEPAIREATGLSVACHQHRTIASVVELRALLLGTGIHVAPVLQGWLLPDYLRHVELYAAAGIDLRQEPIVGVGTVCRRQDSTAGVEILRAVTRAGIRAHGFGVKLDGLRQGATFLTSADSMAWSYAGRRRPDPACPKSSCANCLHFALAWRDTLTAIHPPTQMMLL